MHGAGFTAVGAGMWEASPWATVVVATGDVALIAGGMKSALRGAHVDHDIDRFVRDGLRLSRTDAPGARIWLGALVVACLIAVLALLGLGDWRDRGLPWFRAHAGADVPAPDPVDSGTGVRRGGGAAS